MALSKNKPTQLSPLEIEEWQNKDFHKRQVKQFTYSLEEDEEPTGETTTYFVVAPNRDNTNAIANYAREGNVKKVNELMINSCVLAGDIERLEWDDELFYGLLNDITSLSKAKKSITRV